ncbi:transposase family protein [Treponema sp. OMZ 857]|uniref:integrase catalytic domain-containing protein n=1 Tax=Treponema sp. OMZ 857 TaxID=1643513 RepID=UPI0020A51CAB|nr:transposase family protein [Treponema sp. OMZ 857]
MGLDMKTKKKLTEETAKRYCTASKKSKTKIIDEFIATTGYNRKYAIHVLKNSAYVKVTHFNNVARQSVQVITKTRKKRNYEKYYGQDVQQEVIRLWIFSMYLCAKRLVPFIRDNIDYFTQKFGYDEKLKAKLARISSATVGRILKPEIPKHSIRGISTTRPAKNLNKLIPIRTFFDWDERKPGFFEVDTVANCGISTQGQYICTLTLTDVHSGWTETRALLNKAHRWVKEAIEDVKEKLPFQMKGIDSDNGSEFKNTQLLQWCKSNEVIFTRSRSYKKNDNCFVEQKMTVS